MTSNLNQPIGTRLTTPPHIESRRPSQAAPGGKNWLARARLLSPPRAFPEIYQEAAGIFFG